MRSAGFANAAKLAQNPTKNIANTQFVACMNPTAGSFVINPRLQRLFATFAINFPALEALNTIYATFLLGHLNKFNEETQQIEPVRIVPST